VSRIGSAGPQFLAGRGRGNPGREVSKELVAAMGKFNEEMVKAGVLLSADGFHASSRPSLLGSSAAFFTGESAPSAV